MRKHKQFLITLATTTCLVGGSISLDFLLTPKIDYEEQKRIKQNFEAMARLPTIQDICRQLNSVTLKEIDIPEHVDLSSSHASIEGRIKHNDEETIDDLKRFIKTSKGLTELNYDEKFKLQLKSPGGSVSNARLYVNDQLDADGKVITYAKKASSAATFILTAGSFGYRFADQGIVMVFHAARDRDTGKFEHDLTLPKSTRDSLTTANNWMRDHYKDRSTTGVSKECVDEVIKGEIDTPITTDTALRLGWIDASINHVTSKMKVRVGDIFIENMIKAKNLSDYTPSIKTSLNSLSP